MLESLGSVVEIVAFIVIFVVLPALVYSCKKIIDRCYIELKRQNHLLQSQTQTLNELNNWMDYFDDKLIHHDNQPSRKNGELSKITSAEKTKQPKAITPEKRSSTPDKQEHPGFPSTPVSIYKKTI